MRTGRLLTVRGVQVCVCPGGVRGRVCTSPTRPRDTPPDPEALPQTQRQTPHCGQANTCENIALPLTSFPGGNIGPCRVKLKLVTFSSNFPVKAVSVKLYNQHFNFTLDKFGSDLWGGFRVTTDQ